MNVARTRRRILFLAPFAPRPDGMHGGSRVIGQLIERLARRHDVAVLYMRTAAEAPLAEDVRRHVALAEEVNRPDRHSTAPRRAAGLARTAGSLLLGRPAWVGDWVVPAFAERAREIVREWRPDVVQAEFHLMGQYLAALVDEGPALVLVEYEPGVVATADRAARESGARRVARRIDGRAWRQYERRVLRSADAVVAFTEEDRAVLADLEPSARIVRIPPGVALPAQPLDPVGADPPSILFVGNFGHPPNIQAALDLVERIFPQVVARFPRATLEIVGERPPRRLRRISQPGVVVVGAVSDVRGYLDRAAIVAVPARLGGGIRVKVLETLAAGKALVATSRALAGIDLAPGEQAMVAETDDEFADAVVELLRDPHRRERLARAGRAWASAHLRWEDAVGAYESLYETLLPAHRSVDDAR